MQRCHAALVQRVGKRTCSDEKCDHVTLPGRIPSRVARSAVGGVVQRLGATSVASANLCALRDQQLGDLGRMRGSSDVQRGVATADVMMNRSQKVPVGVVQPTGREIRC